MPRRFHFCISRLNPEVNIQKLKTHVNEFLKLANEEDIQVEEVDRAYTSSTKMFKLSVSSTHGVKIMDKLNWPTDVHVKRFFNKHIKNAEKANNVKTN